MTNFRASDMTIDISIVSHGQSALAAQLLRDFIPLSHLIHKIYLLKNVPEIDPSTASFFNNIEILQNSTIRGFGANHNQIAKISDADLLIIINPDIRLKEINFEIIRDAFRDESIDVVAPLVMNNQGVEEDSLRYFPSVFDLLKKALNLGGGGVVCLDTTKDQVTVDWAAGMFMVLRLSKFRKLGGFDEHYFLYYEDVDYCARVNLDGGRVVCLPSQIVEHDARRESHRSFKYFKWHFRSLTRYLMTYGLWGPRTRSGR